MLDILVQMPSSWEGWDAKVIVQTTGLRRKLRFSPLLTHTFFFFLKGEGWLERYETSVLLIISMERGICSNLEAKFLQSLIDIFLQWSEWQSSEYED